MRFKSRGNKGLHAGEGSFDAVERKTRRRKFLELMNQVVPWERLVALVRPYYSEGARENDGSPALELERMLRIYFVQHWYGLSDRGVQDEIYDSQSIQWFVGVDLGSEQPPDAAEISRFRRLIERHGLAQRLLREVDALLAKAGLRVKHAKIVDPTVATDSSRVNDRTEEESSPDGELFGH
jgi:IS5 family transposase